MAAEHVNGMRVMLEAQEGHSYADILRVARTSEALGFGGIFRSDHWLPIMGDRQLEAPDAWATLAGLARDTARIRFGTLVSPMTFRHPAELAKVAATVDQMSGGRLEAGFGSGWYEAEHAAYGLPFPPLKERFDRLEESLEVCTALWSDVTAATFTGRYYSIDRAPAQPKPRQRPLPVIIGGRGAHRTPDLTARFATEYNTGGTAQEWVQRRARVVAACERTGRDPASLVYSWMTATVVGRTENDAWQEAERRFRHDGQTGDVKAWVAQQRTRGMVFGSAEQAAEQLSAARAAGATRWYLQIVPSPSDELLEVLATEIAPRMQT
ncbi:MAG: TIGR03560 family F420-dependent LLM class oxidoreductase [Chloroflexi bacterium]|nr:TIGR03560 family F420-dependent LLM class oxidoreductase [Chloroflexota bacterium]